MPTLRALLVLLLPAFALQAATFPLSLSPERPLSDAVFHAASGEQLEPQVVSNGEIALAAWSDQRVRTFPSPVYAARVDALGNTLDPAGILLANNGALGTVVWNGTHFAAIVRDYRARTWIAVFVAPDGTIVGTRTLDVPYESGPVDASAGGSGVRVLFVRFDQTARATLLDGLGEVVARDVALLDAGQSGYATVAASNASEFLVLLRVSGVEKPVASRIDLAGHLLASATTSIAIPISVENTTMEGGSDGWLLATRSDDAHVVVQKLDARGVAGNDPIVLAALSTRFRNDKPHVVRENGGYTVAWHTTVGEDFPAQSVLYFAFVSDTGTAEAPRQVSASPGFIRSVALTSVGPRRLLISSVALPNVISAPDLFAQTVTDGAQATAPSLLAYSAVAQGSLQVAAGANGFLVAWTESGPDALIRLFIRRVSTGGVPQEAPIPVAASAHLFTGRVRVVSSGDAYLVVWQDDHTYGRRLSADGDWLDAAPFDLGFINEIELASNGTDVVAVWSDQCDGANQCVVGRRIAMSGNPLSAPRVTVARPAEAAAVAIASNGTDYLVVWKEGFDDCLEICAEMFSGIRAQRLRADATRIDAGPIVIVDKNENVQVGSPTVAWNGGRYVVAWSVEPRIEGAIVTAEGSVLERRAVLRDVPAGVAAFEPRLVAHRDQFLLFTHEFRLSTNASSPSSWTGVAFDAAASLASVPTLPRTTIVDSPNGNPLGILNAASSGSTVLTTYDRVDDAAGGVSRAFTKLFGGTGGRRRAVR